MNEEGYYCVVCGRFLPADEHGVIVHDDIEHPQEMDFAHMNTCPNCGKVSGFHSSILQGCMCQYSAPPQRTWVGLSNGEMIELSEMELGAWDLILEVEAKLKERNT